MAAAGTDNAVQAVPPDPAVALDSRLDVESEDATLLSPPTEVAQDATHATSTAHAHAFAAGQQAAAALSPRSLWALLGVAGLAYFAGRRAGAASSPAAAALEEAAGLPAAPSPLPPRACAPCPPASPLPEMLLHPSACPKAAAPTHGAQHPAAQHAAPSACPVCATASCPSCLKAPRAPNAPPTTASTVEAAADFFGTSEDAPPADPYPTLPPGPRTRTRTALHCTSTDLRRRSCIVENICHDAGAGRWLLYTGEPPPASGPACLPLGVDDADASDAASSSFCDGAPLAHLMGLAYDDALLHPFVMSGSPPAPGPGLHWFEPQDASLFITSRHNPTNYYHSVLDDSFSLYWGLRRALRHPAYAPTTPDLVGGSGEGGGPTVYAVVTDNWGFNHPTQRLAARYHHVRYLQPEGLHADADGATTVCFGVAALGSPGITLQRNAASVYTPSRSWSAPINAATQRYDARAFAAFFTRSLLSGSGLPPTPASPAAWDAIVVVDRPSTSRSFARLQEMLAAARAVAGSFEVISIVFDGTPDTQIASTLQRAAVLIGAHGAGLANVVYMRPGATLFEVTPPSSPETLAFFSSLTFQLGLRHRVLPGLPGGDFNAPLDVNLGAFKALLDITLQDYDGRDAT